MSTAIASKVGPGAARRGDRRKVAREELLDAAFRAIDAVGSTVSMDDIAREAGVAKPKLYRYFEDKADLHSAVLERVQDMVWNAAMDRINLMADSARELVQHGAHEYARMISDHPNVLRFIVHGHFVNSSDGTERLVETAQQMTHDMAEILSDAIDDETVDIDDADLAVSSAAGAIGTATEWFLGPNQQRAQPMPIETFVEYLTTVLSGLAASIAEFNGLTLDPDQPLHLAFTNTRGGTA
ncbi:transcriptional regulator BetI [Mycobacteroides salmoniphilum]|uniref:Transcriptional regulator BetI n=1 Tax=Mycobacteroides salmoniphilum TaxID=404941 RepID=A0A4R8S4S8_9MYCO|nr:transcriptional regulator BetI [Mycobacteroides salmoniphilum]TDZ85870.1 transcriptional regulator BetI [Mycobacteroides salmoniphilum]TDZ86626.1 transcriptional regulator BetI [Mycobacteroides salmoniphilum]